jgi:hypothetical protein
MNTEYGDNYKILCYFDLSNGIQTKKLRSGILRFRYESSNQTE